MELGHLSGKRFLAQPADVREHISRILCGFGTPPRERPFSSATAFAVRVPWGEPLEPWEIQFLIVDVIGGQDGGRSEKLAWAAAITIDGTSIWFAFEKFGVTATVYGAKTHDDASKIVADCMKRMESSLRVVVEVLINPLVSEALLHWDFNLPNKFSFLFDMFSHLRSLSESTASSASTALPSWHATASSGTSTGFPAVELARKSEFEAYSAVFAFFSLVEHLLVIGLAFIDFEPAHEHFDQFLSMSLKNKFKRVVGLDNEADSRIYRLLVRLTREHRNPVAHGGVSRDLTEIEIQLQGYGPVPNSVALTASKPAYTFKPTLSEEVFPFPHVDRFGGTESGWQVIDEILAWARSGPLAGAFEYGQSGLPVWFDDDSRRELRTEYAAGRIQELLDWRRGLVDHYANMDW